LIDDSLKRSTEFCEAT